MGDVSRYHTLLRDPTRRKIIEILGEQGKVGFKELKQTLGLGVGTVYYHLDMLSGFLTQDKERKYCLNDRGRLLYASLKEGSLPPALQMGEALSHRVGKWLFLSPIFAKTSKTTMFLPIALGILVLGGLGAAIAEVNPMLFFYLPGDAWSFQATIALFVSNWIGLFLFSVLMIYVFFKRAGGDAQLFCCIGLAALPLAVFPYITLFVPFTFMQYVLFVFQIWTILLLSAAFSFGKGIRLDKSIILSLTVIYLNTMILLLLGKFS
ncbi:MAG: winged helix-turn-helix domain-containing protein [Candidatus Bathyarchaeales archaeon]